MCNTLKGYQIGFYIIQAPQAYFPVIFERLENNLAKLANEHIFSVCRNFPLTNSMDNSGFQPAR